LNSLIHAIQKAFDASGNLKEANKAYLEFIKANFIIPLEKDSEEDDPRVLFLQNKERFFLPVFTERTYLDNWSMQITDQIKLLKLTGVNLLKGIGEQVSVCLDIGSEHYKEFTPEEIMRMKSMVLKLFKD
jgi:hypothetical protein